MVTDCLQDFEFPEHEALQEFYPHGYHNIDKKGRPVYIECQGRMQLENIYKTTTEERLIRHYIQSYELLLKLRFPSCSAIAGHRIEQGLTILDLNGFSSKMISKKVYAQIQLAAKIGSDYYPEIMGQCYIVNAPMIFTGVWAIVKGFIDEKTRRKITIHGSKYQKDLLEIVDADKLPDFLGGTCTCAEVGGCLKTSYQPGPWNDFELVQPVGIRKKVTEGQLNAT